LKGVIIQKFNIIYADPGWAYKNACHAGGYKVTGTAQIAALPVADIAANDCALFMWATFPMIQDAFEVMKGWGLKYKTAAFIWIKTNKKRETDFFGMGNWTRANAEVCLLGIKGKPKRSSASMRQVIRRPIMRHSEKPPEIRDRIVQLMGDQSRVELFAREVMPGWAVWGNEVRSSVELLVATA